MTEKYCFLISVLLIITMDGCLREPDLAVTIDKTGTGYLLLRKGSPFYIKGAVAWNRFDLVRQYGGNAVRTACRDELLDQADNLGLACMVNLPVRAERSGMDYNDSVAVKEQFDKIIRLVEKNKQRECVLFWSLGNELDWIPPGIPYNLKIWTHLNELAVKIHETDPDHPVMTTIGSVHKKVLQEFMNEAPELDLLGINEYGDILKLAGRLREFGWTKPYVLTEWGPTGFWQVPHTDWYAPIEETSTMKADLYKKRYEEAILADSGMCLGSFAFLWNQHQERTHTWFGMFDKDWKETEAVGVMQYEWSGKWPENLSPRIDSVFIDDQTAYDNIFLAMGSRHSATVYAHDPDNDPLTFSWEILREGTRFPYGGQGEEQPPVVNGLIADPAGSMIRFKTPPAIGPYRLFVYIYDGQNHIATANIPFYAGRPVDLKDQA
jgi:hypothetical protein